MPAVVTKKQLLEKTTDEFEALMQTLNRFDPSKADLCDQDGYCAKRVVGHRAEWISFFFKWCDAVAAGEKPDIPAKGFTWKDTPAMNLKIWDRQKQMSWQDVLQLLVNKHALLLKHIETKSENELYSQPLFPGTKWTQGRYAEAAGPSHYRSANKFLKKLLKQV